MVTKEQVQAIALLSKLYVPEEQLDALTSEMQKVVAFADMINEASGDAGEFDTVSGLENVFRPDEVVPSCPREEILKNVGGGENGFFPVKRRG